MNREETDDPAIRKKLTYSNVIASLALFVALGGVAVAAGLPNNSVGTKQAQERRRDGQEAAQGSR